MFNIFTFLREHNVYNKIKEKAFALLADKKDDIKALVEEYIKEKSPAVKEGLIGWLMDHMELGFPYNLFKGTIKKVLNKNFDKLTVAILSKLQEV